MSLQPVARRLLTPGAFDETATEAIVCARGYAASRRPSLWQALRLKAQAMKLYGVPLTPAGWHGHTLDHLVPLELGGLPLSLLNVWPQPKTSARRKDADENTMRRAVCSGSVTLADAQRFFVSRWSR